MDGLNIASAAQFMAIDWHKNQVRKYTNDPYFSHLAEVVGIVSPYLDYSMLGAHPWVTMAIAYLHDCKDQNITDDMIRHRYHEYRLYDHYKHREYVELVIDGVNVLTDPPQSAGNRAERHALKVKQLATGRPNEHDVKCADIISNTKSIATHDPNFAQVYLREIKEVLMVLTRAHADLHRLAVNTAMLAEIHVNAHFQNLKEAQQNA